MPYFEGSARPGDAPEPGSDQKSGLYEKSGLKAGRTLQGDSRMTRRNPEDIHNYAGKLRRTRRRLASVGQGDTAVRFLDRLKLAGRKDGRIAYYGDRLPLILELFNTMSGGPVLLEEATKADCESVMYIAKRNVREIRQR